MGEYGLALPGMDDAGEMSSWYVMAAAGLYSFSATDPEYIISVPIFDEVDWTLPNGNTLKIQHSGKGRDMSKIEYNGKPVTNYFLSHESLENGGNLVIETK